MFGALPLLAFHESLRGSLGWLFCLKAAIAAAVIVGGVFIFRPFCRLLCPLGAFYALFNPVSVFRMKCDKDVCNNCGACERACASRINPAQTPNSPECIRCGDCVKSCSRNALKCLTIKR
ncbi:MAG: hypothetical protein FWG45_07640 [Oscillospiraceae bacterium]|nr:hypothetical protein [Oscillospiraceae bacterium]